MENVLQRKSEKIVFDSKTLFPYTKWKKKVLYVLREYVQFLGQLNCSMFITREWWLVMFIYI